MPSVGEMSAAIDAYVSQMWGGHRVIPPLPPNREPAIGDADNDDTVDIVGRGAESGWSVFIVYGDGAGKVSQRRITVRRIYQSPHGKQTISAYCHERCAPRAFLIERVREVIDLETGELFEPVRYFTDVAARGLPIEHIGIEITGIILLFLARCDGNDHPMEWAVIEDGLARHAIRFSGDDAAVHTAMRRLRHMAPDHRDFARVLHKLRVMPAAERVPMIGHLRQLCAELIDADGILAAKEFSWGRGLGEIFDMMMPAP